jgi:hypothetical protein
MSTRSSIEDQASRPEMSGPGGTAEHPSEQSLETLRRRAKLAEINASALEAENKQLRSERAKAVLAAAHAEKSVKECLHPVPVEPEQRLDALTAGMKIAEEALHAAERERETAIRAVEDSLRKEYSQRVEAIRRCHAAELAAQFQEAEKRARQEVIDQINTLKRALQDAREALPAGDGESKSAMRAFEESLRKEFSQRIEAIRRSHAAELTSRCHEAETRTRQEVAEQINTLTSELTYAREALCAATKDRENAVQAVEISLRTEFSRQFEAIRESHAAELADQLSEAKKRFAEELMANLATAHATWRTDTERRLQKARQEAQNALARAQAIWRQRSKAAVWNAAMIWRARERQRLSEAKRRWETVHRAALDACNRRWRAKVDRLKTTTRRSPWQWALWRRATDRAVAFAKMHTQPGQFATRPLDFQQSAIGHTGCVAAIVIFVAVQFSPFGGYPTVGQDSMASAAAAQTAPPQQLATLPRDRAVENLPPASKPSKALRRSPAKTEKELEGRRKGDASPSRPPAKAARETNIPGSTNTNRSSASSSTDTPNPAAGLLGQRPGEKLKEDDLRLRLQEKIRKLRTELSAQ